MIQPLTRDNFVQYAMRYYDNPHCVDVSEFEEDLEKFSYIKRLFSRYPTPGKSEDEYNRMIRLMLNHIIVLHNVFGVGAVRMLFFKLPNHYHMLKPLLIYLSLLPETVDAIGNPPKNIHTSDIEMDSTIIDRLRNL